MADEYYTELVIDGDRRPIYDTLALHSAEAAAFFQLPEVKIALLDMMHPVGSYYISDDNTSPETLFGGTWTKLSDVFLYASGSGAVGTTGGSADAVVVSHTHTAEVAVSEAGAHTHSVSGTAGSSGAHSHTLKDMFSGGDGGSLSRYQRVNKRSNWNRATESAGAHTHSVTGTAASNGKHTHAVTVANEIAGVSGTGANMPPYRVTNIWRRTA